MALEEIGNRDMGEWLLPFKGKNHSGSVATNFVWKSGNVYVMDNHRVALWCWLQELDLTKQHSLVHIDRHTDTRQSNLVETLNSLPLWDCGLFEYLEHEFAYSGNVQKVITWDNYLSIYLSEFGESLECCRFCTHNDGDQPNHSRVMSSDIWCVPSNIDYWLESSKSSSIVNIDLDYFYSHEYENPKIMVSKTYREEIFSKLKVAVDSGKAAVTTICLTPNTEFTGGWEETEELATEVLSYMGIEFSLPKSF